MFHGSMVALVTPMRADGAVDYAALANLVEFHVAAGTNAIVAVGTTGESATLNFEEHCEVVRKVVELAQGRLPVIAGAGANATAEAVALSRCAQEAGAQGTLQVTPYYNKPTQEGLYRHYQTIAEAVPMPHILYNVPGRTAVDLQPDTVRRLAEIPNIVGIKEASGRLGRVQELLVAGRGRMDVYGGDDDIGMEVMLLGGRGVISVTANVAPAAMARMAAAALAGDRVAAGAENRPLEELHRTLFLESNPIPVKWAVAAMGFMESGIRLPLTRLSKTHHAAVREALQTAGCRLAEA